MASDSELFEQWFRLAGTRDGIVDGSGAVQFFQRSGLPKEVLKEIWNQTAGNQSFMNKPQFFAALRLVALGQNNGGTFTPQQARAVLVGTAPPLPTPKLQGITAETWQPGPSWPLLSPADHARFEQQFVQLDQDGDGLVQGPECSNLFVHSGVDRSVLKNIWAAVAGDAGFLRKNDFIKCLYLIENAKMGIPPPATLPPEPFPPIGQPGAQMGIASQGALGAQSMVASQPVLGPQAAALGPTSIQASQTQPVSPHSNPIPSLPPKVAYQHPKVDPYQPRGLELNDASVSMLNPVERGRLDSERESALSLDQDLYNHEQKLATSQQKKDFYEKALQDMVLFKRRVGTKMLEIEERARQETMEADEAEKAYQQAREEAEKAAAESGAKFQNILHMQEQRMELQTKLKTVQREAADLEGTNPEEISQIELDIQNLKEEVAAVESKKEGLSAQVESRRKQQELLVKRKEELQLVCAAAEAEISSAASDIEKIKEEMEAAQGSEDVDKIQKLIRDASRVYSNLHAHACKAGIEIPKETLLMLYSQDLLWADDVVGSVGGQKEDWDEDGFIVVDAFPDVKDELDKILFDAVMASAKSNNGNKQEQAPKEFAMTFEDSSAGFMPLQQATPPASNPTPPPAKPFEVSFDSDPFMTTTPSPTPATAAAATPAPAQQTPFPLDPFSAFPPPSAEGTTAPPTGPTPSTETTGFFINFDDDQPPGGGGFANFGASDSNKDDPFAPSTTDAGANQTSFDPFGSLGLDDGGGGGGGEQAKPSDNPFGENAFG